MSDFHVQLCGTNRGPLKVSFDEAEQRLAELSALHFEPDGSFAWTVAGGELFGMLYDAHGFLQYVEIRGRCQLDSWRALVACLCRDSSAELCVLQLPEMRLQDLQDFERMFVSSDENG